MDEFYTNETQQEIWAEEALMERFWQAQEDYYYIDQFDPYEDEDDYEEDEDGDESHIDYYAEASLFGED